MIKRYRDLLKINSFEDRLEYLRCRSNIGDATFGGRRKLNQMLYSSTEWKKVRDLVVIRDNGMDLGCDGYPIIGNIYVHHLNPITFNDILERHDCVFDPENLISSSFQTHNIIHFGTGSCDVTHNKIVTRKPYDTCPWKR